MDTKGLQKEFISWCKANKKSPKSEQETKLLFVSFMKEKHPEEYKAAVENQKKQQLQQAQKAAHGAKLNYFKSLKNQCAEDEEVVYYKKGGSVTCGCKKKEQGGEIPTAKCGSAVERFKKARKAATGTEMQKPPFRQETPKKKEIKEGDDGKGNWIVSKKGMKERSNQGPKAKGPSDSAVEKEVIPSYEPKKNNKKPVTGQGGSKLAVMKAPKTYIDHMKKGGNAIEKFKAAKCGSKLKKHLLGGSLNLIPFFNREK